MHKRISDLISGDTIVFGEEKLYIVDCSNGRIWVEWRNHSKKAVMTVRDLANMILEYNRTLIFTHNCAQRMVCGKLGSVASRMALDDNQATTIDSSHKGAGIIKAQGKISHVQYYFEGQEWIEKWFKERGLTEKGYVPGTDPNAEIDPSTIDLGEDEDIEIKKEETVIEFNGMERRVDHTKDQKFEEL